MRFNTQAVSPNSTINAEGEKAYKMSPELELYAAVMTSALSDSFYESNDARLVRIRELIRLVEPLFVAKLAVYAREQMYLRSMPLVLTVELAKIQQGDDLIARLTNRVVQRADELTELLSYYQSANGRDAGEDYKKLHRLSKQLQKGLAQAFNKFDEYQFAKYNRDNAAIKLRDALFLAHPKPKNEAQQAIFNKIVNNSLETPYTWETELSALGQQSFPTDNHKKLAFSEKWESLIDSGKVGYMALLRNLRNIVEARVSTEHLEKVCARLSDPVQVAKSKQFPFRFMSAYQEIDAILTQSVFVVAPQKVKVPKPAVQNTVTESPFGFLFGALNIPPIETPTEAAAMVEVPEIVEPIPVLEPIILKLPEVKEHIPTVLNALEKAIQASVVNMRTFGNTDSIVIACDVSGSMGMPVSPKSTVQMFDIGLVLGMLLQTKCKNVLMGMFGDTWKTIDLPSTDILSNAQLMRKRAGEVGYSTNGYLVIADLIARKYVADKVMIFTDMQMWNSTGGTQHIENQWIDYRKTIAPNAKLYLFDLLGHGQAPLDLSKNNGVSLIAGWSDKIFDVLQSLENGESALNWITKIEL